jgi:hypothetical protein
MSCEQRATLPRYRRAGRSERGHADLGFTLTTAHLNKRLDDLRDLWRAELRRVEEVIDERLKHLEER